MTPEEIAVEGPVLTEPEARQRLERALLDLLEAKACRSRLSERSARRIYAKHGIWVPSKKHWRMEDVPHFRSADHGGELVPLRPRMKT